LKRVGAFRHFIAEFRAIAGVTPRALPGELGTPPL
jgi:hypothetical protein